MCEQERSIYAAQERVDAVWAEIRAMNLPEPFAVQATEAAVKVAKVIWFALGVLALLLPLAFWLWLL